VRLFIAVWPPDEIVDRLRALARPEHPEVRWTLPEQWHVTLRFLGEVDAAPPLPSSWPAAEAVLGPVSRRLDRHVLAVPVAGLDGLAAAVAVAGEGDRRRFTGHLTLARARGRASIPPSLAGAPVEGRWPVDEVTMVRSHLGRGPARYEILERTPVRR
jgi:RNA 2',3'-cyclic 3'-phosphodiesterase